MSSSTDSPAPPLRRSLVVPPPPPAPRAVATPATVATASGAAWRAPVVTGALVAAGTVYTGLVDPNTSHAFPLCPLKLVTGLDCPFCGCLRATHSLAHGRVVEAAGHNLLFTLAVPFLVAAWVAWLLRSLGRAAPELRVPRAVKAVLLVVVVAFTVARNLPVDGLHWLNSAAS